MVSDEKGAIQDELLDFTYCIVPGAVVIGGESSPNACVVEKNIDPGQYRKLKKTNDYVIFIPQFPKTSGSKPVLSNKEDDFEKKLRHMVDHKLCDFVSGLEKNPVHDGLHKKKTYFTAAVAKSMAEQKVGLLLDFSEFKKGELLVLTRQRELVRTARKYGVCIRGATFATRKEGFCSGKLLVDWLNIIEGKTQKVFK